MGSPWQSVALPLIPRLHTFDSWIEYRDYRLLWVGNFCANSAQWLQLLTVGWLVRSLTEGSPSSSLLVVTVGGLSTLPGLLVGPWGGVLGDRIDRRKLVIGIQSFMAVLAISFALVVSSGKVEVWHAYLYVVISGACLSVTQPMRHALIASTVRREALVNAFATNVLTIPGTRMVGPFVGGVLIASLGFFWNFTVESLLYVSMVLVFLPMKTPYSQTRESAGQQSMVADLRDGVRYIWKENRIFSILMLLTLIPNVIMQPVMFLLPIFTEEVLHRGADVGGLLVAVNGFGGLVAAFIIATVGFVFKKGVIALATVITSAVVVLIFAQSQWMPMAFVVIGLFAFSQTAFRTANGTLVQTLVRDDMRGRVTSLQRYGQGLVVFASLLIGWFAGVTSAPTALTVVGAVALLLGLVFAATARRVRALE